MDGDHSDWCSSEKLNHRRKDHQTYQIGTGNTVPRYENWARDSFNLHRKTSSEIPSPVPTHDLVLKSCHRCWWRFDIDQWSHRNWWCPKANQCYRWRCSNKTNDFTWCNVLISTNKATDDDVTIPINDAQYQLCYRRGWCFDSYQRCHTWWWCSNTDQWCYRRW